MTKKQQPYIEEKTLHSSRLKPWRIENLMRRSKLLNDMAIVVDWYSSSWFFAWSASVCTQNNLVCPLAAPNQQHHLLGYAFGEIFGLDRSWVNVTCAQWAEPLQRLDTGDFPNIPTVHEKMSPPCSHELRGHCVFYWYAYSLSPSFGELLL